MQGKELIEITFATGNLLLSPITVAGQFSIREISTGKKKWDVPLFPGPHSLPAAEFYEKKKKCFLPAEFVSKFRTPSRFFPPVDLVVEKRNTISKYCESYFTHTFYRTKLLRQREPPRDKIQ